MKEAHDLYYYPSEMSHLFRLYLIERNFLMIYGLSFYAKADLFPALVGKPVLIYKTQELEALMEEPL